MSSTYKNLALAQKLIDTYPGSALGYDNAYIEQLEYHICDADNGDELARKTIEDMRYEYKSCPKFFDALFGTTATETTTTTTTTVTVDGNTTTKTVVKTSEKLCNEFPCWSTKCPTHGKDNRGR